MLMATLRSVGGSVMLAIPKALLETLDMRPESQVGLSVSRGKLVVDPHPRRRYRLEDLLAACDETAPMNQEDLLWTSGEAVGEEAI